jgi:DNA-directed RNA polymerase subunit RPC12/RpoP
MSQGPSIDYSCPHCGARQTYQLVPMGAGERAEESAGRQPREIPSIDLTCSRCGAAQTYELVPQTRTE